MDIVRNIEYQKKHFSEIYKRYFMKSPRNEIAVEVEKNYSVKKNEYIVIKVDNYNEILKKLFYVNEKIEISEGHKELKLKKSVMTETGLEGNTLTLPMAFKLNGNYIKLVKIIEEEDIEGATLIVLLRKELKSDEKRKLRDKKSKVKYCESAEDIKKELMQFKIYYNEEEFLKTVIKEKVHIEKNILDDTLRSAIVLELIKKVYLEIRNSDLNEIEKASYKIISIIKMNVILENEKLSNKIAEQFLKKDIDNSEREVVFCKNFLIIEEIIREENKVCIELEAILIEFKSHLLEILSKKETGSLLRQLNESALKKLDKLLNESSERLVKKLREVG